jgi:hypothetical protein
MRRILLASAACLLCHGAFADMMGPSPAFINRSVVVPGGSGAYVGPMDAAAATPNSGDQCYSFYACSAAIATAGTQRAFQLQQSGNSHTCDFKVVSSGGYGTATSCIISGDNGSTAAVFCVGGCFVSFLDEQLGHGAAFTIAQSVGGTPQPAFTLSSGPSSGKAALTCDGSTQNLIATSPGTAQPFTISVVAIRTGGFTSQSSMMSGNFAPFAQVTFSSTANNAFIYANTLGANVPETDNVWHTFAGVFADASTGSSLKVDSASPTSVTAGTGALGASGEYLCGPASFHLQGAISETIFFGSALTPTQQTNLNANQHSRFGF